jgi:hypothetical protein
MRVWPTHPLARQCPGLTKQPTSGLASKEDGEFHQDSVRRTPGIDGRRPWRLSVHVVRLPSRPLKTLEIRPEKRPRSECEDKNRRKAATPLSHRLKFPRQLGRLTCLRLRSLAISVQAGIKNQAATTKFEPTGLLYQ